MNYWLMKSEPNECSIDDLIAAPKQTVSWTGVRNYQARNFMRDDMEIGDQLFFYHSSCPVPGIAGIAKVCSKAYPDPTQFDKKSDYFDAKSKPDSPLWLLVDVCFVKKPCFITLTELRSHEALADMRLLQRGNRLSITPVSQSHWDYIQTLFAQASLNA